MERTLLAVHGISGLFIGVGSWWWWDRPGGECAVTILVGIVYISCYKLSTAAMVTGAWCVLLLAEESAIAALSGTGGHSSIFILALHLIASMFYLWYAATKLGVRDSCPPPRTSTRMPSAGSRTGSVGD